jgi:pyruvate-formate lyase-activating enzyme
MIRNPEVAPADLAMKIKNAGEQRGHAVLQWELPGQDMNIHLEVEEQASGKIYRFSNIQSPFKVYRELVEGYFDARLVAEKDRERRISGPLVSFSTLRENYFEDKNPRPKHILSMDEGNKFEHSRMFRVLNVEPGEKLSSFPLIRWLTMVDYVMNFDIAFFNKEKSYWVYLRGIRSDNAVPMHALESGEYFVVVKGSRRLGQVWSYPLYVIVDGEVSQDVEAETVVLPKYMDSKGDYYTPENPIEFQRSGKRSAKTKKDWLFRPWVDEGSVLSNAPFISWMRVFGADSYDVYLYPKDKKIKHRSFFNLNEPRLAVRESIADAEYQLSVHAVTTREGVVTRRIRSAPVDVTITEKPFRARYQILKRSLDAKLKSEKRFSEHMDLISGMDYYTNLKLKRWEIENGVANLASMPTKLTALVGYNCNIDCHFCDNGRVPRDIRIPEKFIDDLIHFMPYADMMQVLGGEPLMLRDFKRIVELASDYPHLRFATTTNGTLVNDEWAYYFARSNFAQVWMSVDGASESVYQSMRRGGELSKVVEGVRKIVSYGEEAPVVGWSFIIARKNYHEIVDWYKLARDLGVKSVYYKMLQLRFGPNYPGVGQLDVLMERDICGKIVDDLCTVAEMARNDGIEFDERVLSYVRYVYPDLAAKMRTSLQGVRKEVSNSEVESGDEVFDGMLAKKLPPPVNGDPKHQDRVYRDLVTRHQELGDDKYPGIPLKRGDKELCQLPFTHLGLNGTNAYMCCYGSPKVLPIRFESGQEHLTDVWNSACYQFSRESFFKQKVDDACLGTCPYRKQTGRLWNVWQL